MKDDSQNMFFITNHLTRDQLVKYHLGQMSKEERYEVEKHLIDCELCKDALSGMILIPNYKGIDKIRREIRRLARPKSDSMNRIAWRIVITTAAVLGLILLIALYYIYYTNKIK